MKNSKDIINVLTEHESALRQFIAKRVGCIHIAADIMQKIAEKLLNQKKSLQIENQQAYLYKAASNEVISHYRSEKRRDYYEYQSAQIVAKYDDRSGDKILAASQELKILQQALSELPLLTQKIFVLYRVDGVKQRDIAKQLNLNLSTIEKRLAIAMKHCRIRLNELANNSKNSINTNNQGHNYGNNLQQTSYNNKKGNV